MELKKLTLHRCQEQGCAVSQITLDDDYNIPDYRQDIVKVLKEKGELRFDEVRAANGAAWLKGSLTFYVLYRSDRQNGKISCLSGEIPFEEKLNMDALTEYQPVRAQGEIEDLTVGVINSRKLSIRAVIVLRASAEEELVEDITCGVEDAEAYEQDLVSRDALQLLLSRHDICRQKSEVVLPSSKPNVREILWKSIELRNVESRLLDGRARVTGEILLSVLYCDEDEDERLQWYETTVPLDCGTECAVDGSDLICRIRVHPILTELEVKPDCDGEERTLVLELALDMDMNVWREENIQLLLDLYSLKKEVTPVRAQRKIERLLIKNSAKCRLTEQMRLAENQERVLQICACEGKVLLEKQETAPEGVLAEGVLIVDLLYITPDDNMPIGTAREIYPFSQMIEVPDMTEHVRVDLDAGLEQLSAVMLDQERIEIKAALHLNLIAFEETFVENIESAAEEPLDAEKWKNSPGLVGYIAKKGDRLWDVARENHTTIRNIMETNQRKDERLAPGDKILIVKQIG